MELHEKIGIVVLIAKVVINLPAYKFLYRLTINIAFDYLFFDLFHLRFLLFLLKLGKTLELLFLGEGFPYLK